VAIPTNCSGRFDLHLTPGPSFSQVFLFSEDVSMYTFTAQLFVYEDDPAPLLSFTVDQSDADVGRVVISLTNVQTATLDAPTRYWWRMVATQGVQVAWPLEGFVFTDGVGDSCDCEIVLSECDVQIQALGIGVPGPRGDTLAVMTAPNTLLVMTGEARFYFTRSVTIQRVTASVSQAPTGSPVIADVNVNGTTIFTTQANRPTIPVGQFVDLTSVPDVVAAASGDYLTVDIDQIGSVTAGKDLVVQVEYV
jgi:hypothetical protein